MAAESRKEQVRRIQAADTAAFDTWLESLALRIEPIPDMDLGHLVYLRELEAMYADMGTRFFNSQLLGTTKTPTRS